MANLNTTALSNTVKTQYESRLLTRALPRMIHAKWATPARLTKANTLEMRKFGSMPNVTASLSEGTTPAESTSPTITTVTMTPLWYGAYIQFNDVIDVQAFDPVVSEVSGILGEQAGLSFDTLLRNTLTDGATAKYAGGATSRATIDTTNDKIDFTDFIGAVAYLEAQNALPADGELFPVVIGPYTFAELMSDSTFVTLFTREGGEAMRSRRMGTILQCSVYVSSNARTYTDEGASSCDPMEALFIGKESHGIAGMSSMVPNLVQDSGGEHANNTGKPVSPVSIIIKNLGETGFDPLNQRGTIGWKTTYDDVILNSSWVVNLEHATSWS